MNKQHIMRTTTIENKKAYHEYFVDDTLECGIVLKGNEVKSIKTGMCNIKDAWCQIIDNELYVNCMYISNYITANTFDLLPESRVRKLLAHKNEIIKLNEKIRLKGMTIIPLKMYIVDNKVKLLIGVCRGKHNYDKRQSLKEKEVKRDIDRSTKNYSK